MFGANSKIQIDTRARRANGLSFACVGWFLAWPSLANAQELVPVPSKQFLVNPVDQSLRVIRQDGSVQHYQSGEYRIEGDQLFLMIATATADPLTPWLIAGGLVGTSGVGATLVVLASQSSDQASDGGPVNQAPVFSSADSVQINENATGKLITAVAQDSDGHMVRYSLSGDDASLFDIDATSGVLTLASDTKLDFENPIDNDADNIYSLSIVATDALGAATSQAFEVHIQDVDDEPPEISASTTSLTVDENFQGKIADVTLSDPDTEAANIQWSVSGSDAQFFDITSAGELRLTSTLDFESPQDADTDNRYEVVVQAHDPSGNLSNSISYQVSVQNVWEPGTALVSRASSDVLNSLQTGLASPWIDEIGYTQVILEQDADGDGDGDAVFVMSDDNGTTASSGAPSIIIGAFDNVDGAGGVDPLWIATATNTGFTDVQSITASRNTLGNAHEVVVNSSTGEWVLATADASIDKSTPVITSRTSQERALIRGDLDQDGTPEDFWIIDQDGVKRGVGDDDGTATSLVSDALTFQSNAQYALADVNDDSRSDLVVYSAQDDQIQVYLFDEVANVLNLAMNAENPFYGVGVSTLAGQDNSGGNASVQTLQSMSFYTDPADDELKASFNFSDVSEIFAVI